MNKVRLLLSILILTVGSQQVLAQQHLEIDDFELASYQGKLVYVDFWASWCTPCRASFPFMADIAREHADDLVIVAVNVDEKREDALGFLVDYETPFDIVFDPAGVLATRYQVPGMPTSYLYDREGQLIDKHMGFRKKDAGELRQWIRANIAK